MMNEQVTTTIAGTSQEIPGFPKTDLNLIVDRVTKEYLPGGDGNRTGQWGMPFNADPDVVYQAYVAVAAQPLPATYEATEDVQGLETYRFSVREENVAHTSSDPATGLPMVVDVEVIEKSSSGWNRPPAQLSMRQTSKPSALSRLLEQSSSASRPL
jgi:hypothetical protein